MALVSDRKFSTFQDGGDLITGDIIVGLRGGLNTQFNYTTPSPVNSITGTANRVLVNGSSGVPVTGDITLSTPQDIGTLSSPTFAAIKLTGSDAILDSNGNAILHITPVINADNEISIANNVSGAAPEIGVGGVDADINMAYRTKAAGYHQFISNATSIPIIWSTGTSAQHTTQWSVPDTAQNRTITLQDASGTMAYLSDIPGVTPSALTRVNDTNVIVTLGGIPATALLEPVTLTMGWTGQLGLLRGGTEASLTANNGGIVYSTASAMAILAGTVTAGQMLRSGSTAAPSWSTSTYPTTNAVNTLLYASSANVMSALATANSSVLITSAGGVPSLSSTLPANLTIPTPTVSGNLTYSPNTAGTVGIIDNAAKAAGVVGETLSTLVTTPVAMTSTVATNIATLPLTAGNWFVTSELWATAGAGTQFTNFIAQVTTTSATLSGTPAMNSSRSQVCFPNPSASAQIPILCTMPARISVNTTTNVYLVGSSQYTGSAVSGSGKIMAYRYA